MSLWAPALALQAPATTLHAPGGDSILPRCHWKRPALTLNAIDAEWLSWILNCRVGRLSGGALRLA